MSSHKLKIIAWIFKVEKMALDNKNPISELKNF